MRKRTPLIFDAVLQTWHVDLPTYSIVAGSVLPIIPLKSDGNGVLNGVLPNDAALNALTCQVDIPDDTPLLPGGQIDAAAMQKRYKDHPRFGNPTWIPPVLS